MQVGDTQSATCFLTTTLFLFFFSIMMAELDLHKDSWPFKLPVDTKVFPLYKKVIRKPMDLAAIQNKLKNHKYFTST